MAVKKYLVLRSTQVNVKNFKLSSTIKRHKTTGGLCARNILLSFLEVVTTDTLPTDTLPTDTLPQVIYVPCMFQTRIKTLPLCLYFTKIHICQRTVNFSVEK